MSRCDSPAFSHLRGAEQRVALHYNKQLSVCLIDHCWRPGTVFLQVRKQMALMLPSLWRTSWGAVCDAAMHPGWFSEGSSGLGPCPPFQRRPGPTPLAHGPLEPPGTLLAIPPAFRRGSAGFLSVHELRSSLRAGTASAHLCTIHPAECGNGESHIPRSWQCGVVRRAGLGARVVHHYDRGHPPHAQLRRLWLWRWQRWARSPGSPWSPVGLPRCCPRPA